MLQAGFPMFIWWGSDLVQFYNDAYRPSLGEMGKHPAALGMKGQDCWAESWPTIGPMIKQVLSGGKAVYLEDQLIPIYRNNGLENVYWTFSYSAIRGEADIIEGVLVVCTETTKAVQELTLLKESERILRSMILQAPVAMCIFRGGELVIEIANDKMFEFWGKSYEQVMHKPLFEAIPESKGQGYEELMQNVLSTGQPFSANELPVTLPRNGVVQTVYINFSYEPLREDNGSISGILAMATDVTEQVVARHIVEAAMSELAEANSNLTRSNMELAQFAYVASHDLQEPLRKIRVFSGLLAKQPSLVAENHAIVEKISQSAERMSLLITDLLDFSRLLKSNATMYPVNLNKTVAAIVQDLDLVIQDQGAIIEVDEMPVIEGINVQMTQLFSNLISNALKFTNAERTPHIHIRVVKAQHEDIIKHIKAPFLFQQYYSIAISDNGIGFEPQHSDQIFEVFKRLHTRNTFPGSGIGLSLCRRIVSNHNGYIYALSQPGIGSTFHIILPACQGDGPV